MTACKTVVGGKPPFWSPSLPLDQLRFAKPLHVFWYRCWLVAAFAFTAALGSGCGRPTGRSLGETRGPGT